MTAPPGADWATLDVDAGGIADCFEVALVQAVVCGSSAWGLDAACVFEGNVQTVLREPENVLNRTEVAQVAAAMLSVGPEMQEALRAFGFAGEYGVIGGAKSLAGPFSPEGDADGDGLTNLQEYLNVLAAGGDTDEYVAAALNPFYGTAASANALPLGSACACYRCWPVPVGICVDLPSQCDSSLDNPSTAHCDIVLSLGIG